MRTLPVLAALAVACSLLSAPARALPCATPEHLGRAHLGPALARLDAGALELPEDPYRLISALETEHFVVRMGEDGDPAYQAQVADWFEAAWQDLFVTLAWPLPAYMEVYKTNIYLGGSGILAPRTGDAAAYYFLAGPDADGVAWPSVVIASVGGLYTENLMESIPAHELFHAVEDGLGLLDPDEPTWYWAAEPLAEWARSEVWPDQPYSDTVDAATSAMFMGGYAIFPDYSLHHYTPPTGSIHMDEEALEYLYNYGTNVFFRHLGDTYGSDWMHALVVEARTDEPPLDALEARLAREGTSLSEVYWDYVFRRATWSFPAHDDYVYWTEWVETYPAFGGTTRRLAGALSGPTGGWVEPTDSLPASLGAHVWALDPGALGPGVELVFDGEPGDDPPASWHLALAARTGEEHAELPLEPDLEGRVSLADLDPSFTEAEELYLVVGAEDDLDDTSTTFPYRLQLVDGELGSDTGSEVPYYKGLDGPDCGCASGGARRGASALLLVLAAVGARRRLRPIRRGP